MNTVLWTRTAEKQLASIPQKSKTQILTGVDRLAFTWPRSSNVKALANIPGYRLRVGDYRVLFVVGEDGGLTVLTITQVRKRDDRTYRH
ncbi:MAG: type II toxin-antitoxin system RelE/ParE family toxin [Deltaproteobacteria bacterium]|nr:type II toxin-antitoxin system RelE/ParE family toxin [Deltaproteobacteria bacterium]